MENIVVLPPDYKPSKKEEYMNELQLEYFRQKLVNWKKSLIDQSMDTLDELKQGGLNQPDEIDRASLETDKALELRTRDRIRKLISKIDDALRRIEDGTYGYCEETGEPIGVDRLEARPVTTLSIEAQERHLAPGLKVYDPLITSDVVENQYHDLDEFLDAIDIIVIMVKHNEIKENIEKLTDKVVLDCHNIIPGAYHL